MRLPPTLVRRPVSVLVVVGLGFAVTQLPRVVLLGLVVWTVLVAVGLSAVLPGRWRALRLLAFGIVYLAVECAALAVALVLWVASGFGWKLRSPVLQRAHYAVVHLVLAVVLWSATVLLISPEAA